MKQVEKSSETKSKTFLASEEPTKAKEQLLKLETVNDSSILKAK